jgi:hypothetical protein
MRSTPTRSSVADPGKAARIVSFRGQSFHGMGDFLGKAHEAGFASK